MHVPAEGAWTMSARNSCRHQSLDLAEIPSPRDEQDPLESGFEDPNAWFHACG